jgi:hypothetical protein
VPAAIEITLEAEALHVRQPDWTLTLTVFCAVTVFGLQRTSNLALSACRKTQGLANHFGRSI